jgi:hypothetical protein
MFEWVMRARGLTRSSGRRWYRGGNPAFGGRVACDARGDPWQTACRLKPSNHPGLFPGAACEAPSERPNGVRFSTPQGFCGILSVVLLAI